MVYHTPKPNHRTRRKTKKLALEPRYGSQDRVNLNNHNQIAQSEITQVKQSNNVTLLYLNARSIVQKRESLVELLEERKPDIILITETWLTPNHESQEFTFPAYTMVRSDRQSNRRGGGILMYFSIEYSVSVDNIVQSEHPIESVWCTIKQTAISLVIGCIYRPPTHTTTSGNCQPTSDKELSTVIDQICTKYSKKSIIICGDFNYPEINCGNTFLS